MVTFAYLDFPGLHDGVECCGSGRFIHMYFTSDLVRIPNKKISIIL